MICPRASTRRRATAAGLFDKTFMGKFIVQGRDAEAVLNRVSANQYRFPLGTNIYTQWLNASGRDHLGPDDHPRPARTNSCWSPAMFCKRTTPAWLRRHTAADEVCSVDRCDLGLHDPVAAGAPVARHPCSA